MKIKYLILSVAGILSLQLLQSCIPTGDGCEEHEPVHTYYKISDADKSKIPFTGTDTLVYISTTGDTATLYGQGKEAFNEKVADKWDPDPGCSSYDYNYFENIQFVYKGKHPELNYIFIDFHASVYAPKQTYADIRINSKEYNSYLGYLNNSLNYRDSIRLINNKIYYGIDAEIFYNYQFGLLKVVASNKIWKLGLL